ncbi:MAG: M20 family metallopeptidase [Candidatus Saccharimonas sp.]
MKTKTVQLAERLIALPSYVSATVNEVQVIDFLAEYAKRNLPRFEVKKSLVRDGRENLYLLGKKPARLVFVGHVDTVQPSDGWLTDPLQPIQKDGKLYGLGAADMKGSIAALLVALQNVDRLLLDEVAVLLYIDEEYQFAGMGQLLEDNVIAKDDEPDLVVSLDGGLEVLSGCRGLIKVDMEVVGKSGHASNPMNGINAVTGAMEVMGVLEEKLPNYASDLGASTMNVAYLRGGAAADIDRPDMLQCAGNVIPNYAECIVEIRTATTELNAASVEDMVYSACAARGLVVKSFVTKIDLGVWSGSYDARAASLVKRCYDLARVEYRQANPAFIGFIDVQMLASTIDSPTYVIGAGGENRHGANENVPLANLEQARAIYEVITTELLGE